MATPLSGLTIPAAQTYDAAYPTRNQENYYNVLLQVLTARQTAGEAEVTLCDLLDPVIALQYNGETIDLGDVKIVLTGKAVTIDNS